MENEAADAEEEVEEPYLVLTAADDVATTSGDAHSVVHDDLEDFEARMAELMNRVQAVGVTDGEDAVHEDAAEEAAAVAELEAVAVSEGEDAVPEDALEEAAAVAELEAVAVSEGEDAVPEDALEEAAAVAELEAVAVSEGEDAVPEDALEEAAAVAELEAVAVRLTSRSVGSAPGRLSELRPKACTARRTKPSARGR